MQGVVIFAGLAGAVALGAFGVLGSQTVDLIYLAATAWGCAKLSVVWGLNRTTVIGVAATVVAVLAAVRLSVADLRFAPYLLIMPVNLFIGYVFARGLLPRRQPILLALIELMDQHPLDNPRFIRFVRGQCLLWAVLCFATAGLAALCIIWGMHYPALVTALGSLAVAQIVWLPLSHVYAGMRYGRPERLRDTIEALSRPEGRALIAP